MITIVRERAVVILSTTTQSRAINPFDQLVKLSVFENYIFGKSKKT